MLIFSVFLQYFKNFDISQGNLASVPQFQQRPLYREWIDNLQEKHYMKIRSKIPILYFPTDFYKIMAQSRPGRHINMLVEPFCLISAESPAKWSQFDPNQHFLIERRAHVFFPGRCTSAAGFTVKMLAYIYITMYIQGAHF